MFLSFFGYMWNEACLILILIFQHLYPPKSAEIFVKSEMEIRPAQLHFYEIWAQIQT